MRWYLCFIIIPYQLETWTHGHVLRSGRFTFLIQKHLYFHGIKYRTKLLFLFYVPPFSFGNMVVRLWTK
jgi:hypothetical protein